MAACTRCSSSPAGIEGHENLFAYRMSGSQLHFKCSACDSIWTRKYRGEGDFDWTPAEEGGPPGVPVPGSR